jgi:uracil phosphoribosyltransferase
MLTLLSDGNSIVEQYLLELRDVTLQKDSIRFERNLERLGMIAGYELSKQLTYAKQETQTPLATAHSHRLADELVITTVLRAGLPVQKGVSSLFDTAQLSFIAAGRKPETAAGVEIDLAYVSTPSLEGKVLIITDTMLATGHSIVDAYEAIIAKGGTPKKTFVVAVIASKPGVAFVQQHIPTAHLIVSVIDDTLDDNFFIVPGLGDAGDLLYGPKQA